MIKRALGGFCLLATVAAALTTSAADLSDSLKVGNPDIQSINKLAFGPDGILFIGDTKSAAIFAVSTEDRQGTAAQINVENINEQIAAMVGVNSRDVLINDLAVNPASGKVYLAVSRGRGPDAVSLLLTVDASGKINEVSLRGVKFSKAAIPNAPAPGGEGRRNRRAQSITDLAYIDGRVFVAGLSAEEFASNLRAIPFPFQQVNRGTSVEIYHGAHGAFETRSPVQTFAAFNIDGELNLLAAYICTPLVRFPVGSLEPGKKVRGTTVAELGNRNRPLDMVVYQKDGKDYILITNSARGVMKVTTANIDKIEGITERVGGGGTAGLNYETIDSLKGVVEMAQLNKSSAVLLVQNEEGAMHLKTIALP